MVQSSPEIRKYFSTKLKNADGTIFIFCNFFIQHMRQNLHFRNYKMLDLLQKRENTEKKRTNFN